MRLNEDEIITLIVVVIMAVIFIAVMADINQGREKEVLVMVSEKKNWPDELSNLMVELAKCCDDINSEVGKPAQMRFGPTDWDKFQERLKKLLQKVKLAAEKFGAKRMSIGGTLGWPPRININFDFEF